MSSSLSEEEEEEEEDLQQQQQQQHSGSTEAGIVRGVSRSVVATGTRRVGNVMAKMPQVGRLPAATRGGGRAAATAIPPKVVVVRAPPPPTTAAATATRVPVRQVARITDRMSTGLDVWDAHSSSSTTTEKEQITTTSRRHQLQAFGASLVKNTILGAIVFETYCWVVTKSAEYYDETSSSQSEFTTADFSDDISKDNDDDDVFETTPLAVHYIAGGLGGSFQGLGGILWDTTAEKLNNIKNAITNNQNQRKSHPVTTTTTTSTTTNLLRTMGQHSIAHSILFGSYETCKRYFLYNLLPRVHHHNNQNNQNYFYRHNLLQEEKEESVASTSIVGTTLRQQRMEYFLAIATAGGLAGQFQHVASHILEEQQQQQSTTATMRRNFRLVLPTLRSTLWSFPPSAIAFLAFEYGKDHIFDIADDD